MLRKVVWIHGVAQDHPEVFDHRVRLGGGQGGGEPVDLCVVRRDLGFDLPTVLLVLLVQRSEPSPPVPLGGGVSCPFLLERLLGGDQLLLLPALAAEHPAQAGGCRWLEAIPIRSWQRRAECTGSKAGCATRFFSRPSSM